MKVTHRASASSADLLARTAPFDRYGRRTLRPLEQSVDHLQLRPGTVLAREHEPAREFVLVLDGNLLAVDADGNARSLGPGATLGGDELASGVPHHETVVAGEGADVLVINGP